MDCENVYKLMNKYIDDDIIHEEEKVLEFHLLRCKSCQKEFGQMKEMNLALNTIAPSHDFTATLMNQIKEEKKSRVKKWFNQGQQKWIGVVIAAAILLLIIIPLRSKDPEPIVSNGEVKTEVTQSVEQEFAISEDRVMVEGIKGSIKELYPDNTRADLDIGFFGYLKYKAKDYYNDIKNWLGINQEEKEVNSE